MKIITSVCMVCVLSLSSFLYTADRREREKQSKAKYLQQLRIKKKEQQAAQKAAKKNKGVFLTGSSNFCIRTVTMR